MDYSCSCLVFYWGVEGVYPELAAHTFVVADDLDSNLASIFDGSKIKEPSVYLHIPSNVDLTMAPEGKSSFYLLIPVSDVEASQYEWDDETVNYYREHTISTLEKLPSLKNLRDKISSERCFTPRDFMNSFNAYRAAGDIMRKNASSFYAAFEKIERAKFLDIAAVYAFCRYADDFADTESQSKAMQLQLLNLLDKGAVVLTELLPSSRLLKK